MTPPSGGGAAAKEERVAAPPKDELHPGLNPNKGGKGRSMFM